ncbi:serine/threonine-protein kinase [Herbidospora cretacea]|uniref:serine/threonine-protein kinase n=1 Tax=Herbidospora cretacea TaxID=28444 RepID=UPI0012FCF873|nr:serine/threonine-protein kinase [Herbidospora cretacea]
MNRPELAEGDVLTRRYLLQERIATGGMSVIWKAFDQSLQRTVAIKLLDSSLDENTPGRELIRREARATARLIHPDAIEVYDYGETVTPRGRLAAYVVMRLLEGRSLADRLSDGPLPWEEAAATAARLALVLAAAHERGIVHRDVTPENVLLTPEGAKLLDFGIAAFAGEADDDLVKDFGTPPYVAPERLKELPAAPAVDVYSLGVLLYEMLKGHPPYPETTWEGIELARRDGPPPGPEGVPGLPPEIAAVCRRCLSPDPTDRPSAREVAAALTPGEAEREPGWVKWGAAVAGLLALGILVWQQPGGTPAGLAADTSLGVTPTATLTRIPPDHSVPVFDPRPSTAEPRATDAAEPRPDAPAEDDPAPPPATEPPRPTPRPGSTLAPIPLASPARGAPTVASAAGDFARLVTEGRESRDIAGYAADDLHLEMRNLLANDDPRGVPNLRRKLDDRLREQALSPALKARLEAALDRLSAAFAARGT